MASPHRKSVSGGDESDISYTFDSGELTILQLQMDLELLLDDVGLCGGNQADQLAAVETLSPDRELRFA